MRVVGTIALVASVGLLPRIASAGRHHDDSGPTVRDHRSSSSDHHDAPVVRDHRDHSDSAPVVRDHRSHGDSVVRDHRDGGDVYYSETEVVPIDDTGASGGSFESLGGPTWSLELGGLARRFRGPAFSRMGSVDTTDGSTATYGLQSGTPTEGDTAGGAFLLRFTAPMSDHLYGGAE